MYSVTERHIMRASATTKIKTCLDLFLFLAGHLQVVALYFLRKNAPERSKFRELSHGLALFFFGWCRARQRATTSLPNGL